MQTKHGITVFLLNFVFDCICTKNDDHKNVESEDGVCFEILISNFGGFLAIRAWEVDFVGSVLITTERPHRPARRH